MSLKPVTQKIRVPDKIKGQTKRKLHRRIAGIAVKHSKEAFRFERWDGDKGREKWPERKKNYPWPKLRKSRKMYNSIRKRSFEGQKDVVVGPDPRLVYPPVHNRGLRAGRGKGFQMPKRQFLGDSPSLDRRVIKEIKKTLDSLFKLK